MQPPVSESTLPYDDATEPVPAGQWGRYVIRRQLGAGGMGIVLAAHDPQLHREVALKVLHARRYGDRDDSARIEREARAMARLAHPNVVTVFEVDRVGDRTFVAMELVEGSTLRDWLRERPRRWTEIVQMFVAAGHGLAAVHAAELVHRDFKPDNVLIGRDGRPRISDFGLVFDAVSDPSPPPDTTTDDLDIRDIAAASPAPSATPRRADPTVRGSASGTPAYMSPEQWAGRSTDAHSDQFAFCVALWEALWGCRPFAGRTVAELRAAVRVGKLADPPHGRSRVPRGIHAVLRRGLAQDPAARWPDMPALLQALTRVTQIRRRRVAAAVAIALAAGSAAVAALVVNARGASEPCAPPSARIAAVWSPARARPLAAKLAGLDLEQGANRFQKIEAAFDRGTADWIAMHVAACRATRVEGRQSDSLLDRRMECLDQWLGELDHTVAVTEQAADRATIEHATRAATSLSSLAVCADVRALSEALPPPADPARRSQTAAVIRRAKEMEVELRAGKLEGQLARARDLVASARPLDHPPALAAALSVQRTIEDQAGQNVAAERTVRELAQVYARARDDRGIAFAWTMLIVSLGARQSQADAALALVPVATAALARAGDPPALRAELLMSQASALNAGPRAGEGIALLHQARDILTAATAQAPEPLLLGRLAEVALRLGSTHMTLGQHDAALASFHEAIDRWRALVGNETTLEAIAWHDIGAVQQLLGKNDDALAAYRTAVRIYEAGLGDSPTTAFSMLGIATTLHDQGKFDEAIAIFARVLAMMRKTLPPDDLQFTKVLIGRANTLSQVKRDDEAARDYDEVLALFERIGAKNVDIPITLYNRAELRAKHGHYDDALPDYAHSLTLFEELRGPSSSYLIYPLVGEAICHVRSGHSAKAFAPLEHALRLPAAGGDATQIALARVYLARAKVETGRDAANSLATIRAALPVIAQADEGAHSRLELERWLAAHTH